MDRMQRPRVVIVGAGFGGLECARKLAGRPLDVLLLDRNNYHLFTPLLYQVASSLLNPSDIAQPVRTIIREAPNVRFLQAEVTGADVERRVIFTADGAELAYDYLVLAAGSTTNYFGNESVEAVALGLKDLPEALELRNHILTALEAAAHEPERASEWLTFVLVGGGPTGVEYAGALVELLRLVVPRDYPELAAHRWRVVLVEGLDRVLPPFAEQLSASARAELEARGIEVLTGVRVISATERSVTLSDGSTIAARTLIWAAGVKPSPLAEVLGLPRTRSGRVAVDGALRVTGHTEIFAIGDIAAFVQDGKEVPMLSAPAMREARAVAANLERMAAGQPLRRFRYRSPGNMATIGRNAAVAELGPLKLTGVLGWVTWLLVHLYFIIGFRNRAAVLLGWGWNYLRFDRPVRIIARARRRSPD